MYAYKHVCMQKLMCVNIRINKTHLGKFMDTRISAGHDESMSNAWLQKFYELKTALQHTMFFLRYSSSGECQYAWSLAIAQRLAGPNICKTGIGFTPGFYKYKSQLQYTLNLKGGYKRVPHLYIKEAQKQHRFNFQPLIFFQKQPFSNYMYRYILHIYKVVKHKIHHCCSINIILKVVNFFKKLKHALH